MNRPCPVCGGSEAVALLRKERLQLTRCSACGMVHANPLPEEASAEYYDRLGKPYYVSSDKLAGDYAPTRFNRELALVRRFHPAGEVLDVGCSTGGFLHQLERRFPGVYRGTGIEVSRPAVDHARAQGIRVLDASLLTHDFGERRFDVITFWAVLEHLANPGDFLRRSRGLLRPEGTLLVLVPNYRALAVRLLGSRYRYILPQHVNYFSRGSLRDLLIRSGFRVACEGGSHFNPAVVWQDWRRGTDALVPDAERAALLARTTRWKGSLGFRPAGLLLGGLERALAAAGMADNLWAAARSDGA